jgi:hypothetical protein
MNQQLKQFPEFAASIYLGVGQAILSDPDVLLLFSGGILLATPWRPVKGLGIGLTGLFINRRADQYVSLFAHLISEGEPKGDTNG